MSLTRIIKNIEEEREEFTNSFRNIISESVFGSDISDKTQDYLKESLRDEGMTRYYRFSVTATNELLGFGIEIEDEQIDEMKKGMGLMLFWLRLADSVIDNYSNTSKIIKEVNHYLENGKGSEQDKELSKSEDPLIDSLYFATRLLREHSFDEGYISKIISPLKEMTKAMRDESSELRRISDYCDKRESTGVKLADTLLAIMGFYTGNSESNKFSRLTKFYHEQFKAAMHLDTLIDFDKDYEAGISMRPTLSRKVYVAGRLIKRIASHLRYVPLSIKGCARLFAYSAVSTYNIICDAPTQG